MNTTKNQHLHDDDDENEIRRQLGPLRDLHRQHTEGAVVNMSVRVHDALQHQRNHRFRGFAVPAIVGVVTVIVVVVALNHTTSDTTHRDVVESGTMVTNNTDHRVQRIPTRTTDGRRSGQGEGETQHQTQLNSQRTPAPDHHVSQSSGTPSIRSASQMVRTRESTDSHVVLLRDSEMLLAVNEANEDAIVDRILDLETEDEFAVLDLTSADVDAVLP